MKMFCLSPVAGEELDKIISNFKDNTASLDGLQAKYY